MKLLMLGGTIFLGRHLVEAALEHGHQITLFTRGQHNSDLFPGVEKLLGNRDGDLGALQGRQWDAVVDTCGYVPRIVRSSAQLLATAVDHYTFVSSISVYSDTSQPGLDEGGAVGTLQDEKVEEITGESYGPLKVLCEREAEAALPGRVLTVRPGLIVGPHDPTDRFTYWPHRMAQGGQTLAPGQPDRQVQFIDVRDLASWMLSMIDAGTTGVYNATGPDYALTMEALLATCRAASGSDGQITWVDEGFLLDKGVEPWSELPLWIPETEESRGDFAIDCSKAMAAGLSYRPLSDTVRDTLAWDETRPADREWRAGMKRDRERQLLAEWHTRS